MRSLDKIMQPLAPEGHAMGVEQLMQAVLVEKQPIACLKRGGPRTVPTDSDASKGLCPPPAYGLTPRITAEGEEPRTTGLGRQGTRGGTSKKSFDFLDSALDLTSNSKV